ncbi:hypothetical protein Q8G81_34240, partial [Klebsiella pneumoniae]
SGGERQMLAISIAVMTRPKRSRMAVLLVEQNVNEGLRIVDEVCVLEEGRTVFSGAASNKDQIVRHLWRLKGRAH